MASHSETSKAAEVIFLHGVRYARDPMSAVFEDLPDEELMMLAENIKVEGQKLPITINRSSGLVLDGWQRLRACERIDAKPLVDELEISDPAAFVMAINEHRRGSTAPTATQRALLATDLLMLEWEAGGRQGRKPSAKKVANAAGTSVPTVEQVRRALRHDEMRGTDYAQRLRLGELSAAAANAEIAQGQPNAKGARNSPQNESSVEASSPSIPTIAPPSVGLVDEREWKEVLQGRLMALSSSGFERFTAAFLQAVGYREVEVTGKSGDGGIDGTAYAPLGSLRIAFQCKRYQGSVGAPAVRDFRGAADGRTENGLLITTGTFTSAAREEARRHGAKTIDLIDGDKLCELLKEHKLGVGVEMIERVMVDDLYFDQFEDAG